MRAFDKLNKSKQETIINAAIKEFAEKGYNSASTNSIVKNAGISKGALFFYFKSKEALFMYVLEYSFNFITKMIFDKCIDSSEKHIFNKFSKYINGRLKIHSEYPYMYLIFAIAHKEKLPNTLNIIESGQKMFAELDQCLLADIDTSNIRDDIPFEYIVKIISYTFDGYDLSNEREMTIKTVDYEKVFQEYRELVKVFKKLFLKN